MRPSDAWRIRFFWQKDHRSYVEISFPAIQGVFLATENKLDNHSPEVFFNGVSLDAGWCNLSNVFKLKAELSLTLQSLLPIHHTLNTRILKCSMCLIGRPQSFATAGVGCLHTIFNIEKFDTSTAIAKHICKTLLQTRSLWCLKLSWCMWKSSFVQTDAMDGWMILFSSLDFSWVLDPTLCRKVCSQSSSYITNYGVH